MKAFPKDQLQNFGPIAGSLEEGHTLSTTILKGDKINFSVYDLGCLPQSHSVIIVPDTVLLQIQSTFLRVSGASSFFLLGLEKWKL